MREQNPDTPDFLSKKDWRFKGLRGAMESTFVELCQKGVGAEVKHTAVITQEEEHQLWDRGVLGVDSLLKLLRSVFFSVWKVYCFLASGYFFGTIMFPS